MSTQANIATQELRLLDRIILAAVRQDVRDEKNVAGRHASQPRYVQVQREKETWAPTLEWVIQCCGYYEPKFARQRVMELLAEGVLAADVWIQGKAGSLSADHGKIFLKATGKEPAYAGEPLPQELQTRAISEETAARLEAAQDEADQAAAREYQEAVHRGEEVTAAG